VACLGMKYKVMTTKDWGETTGPDTSEREHYIKWELKGSLESTLGANEWGKKNERREIKDQAKVWEGGRG